MHADRQNTNRLRKHCHQFDNTCATVCSMFPKCCACVVFLSICMCFLKLQRLELPGPQYIEVPNLICGTSCHLSSVFWNSSVRLCVWQLKSCILARWPRCIYCYSYCYDFSPGIRWWGQHSCYWWLHTADLPSWAWWQCGLREWGFCNRLCSGGAQWWVIFRKTSEWTPPYDIQDVQTSVRVSLYRQVFFLAFDQLSQLFSDKTPSSNNLMNTVFLHDKSS